MKLKKKNVNKRSKIVKIAIFVLLFILIGELIYMGAIKYKRDNNSVYYTFINSIIYDSSYIGVGNSDFRYGKSNGLQNYSKALVNVYNDSFKVNKEVMLSEGYGSFYNDIAKYDNGYIAVGAIEMTKEHNENKAGEGLIVKYDRDFNQVSRKNFKILNDTEFTKVRVLSDGSYIVIGTSVYESGRIGNHTTGGAIIVKFDKNDKEVFRANYTGPQAGIFTDILVLNDGYVVCGSIYNRTGVVVKYSLDGKKLWNYHYSYTDSVGFTSINKFGDNFILTGSKLDAKDKTDYYKASLVVVDKNGKKVNEVTYKEDNITRFNNLLVDKDKITVVGVTGRKVDNQVISDGLVVSYDKNLKVLDSEKFSFSNNDSYNNIYSFKNGKYLLGFTNSKVRGMKSNGKDYFPVIMELK